MDRVQFQIDGVDTGPADSAAPYALAWDTRTAPNGAHAVRARAYDTAGNSKLSAAVNVNVANASFVPERDLAAGWAESADGDEVPAGRAAAGVGAAGQDPGAVAAIHERELDVVPGDHQHRGGRCAAGDLRLRARSELQRQPLLLRLLHAGDAEPRPGVAVHGQRVGERHGGRQRARALRGHAGRARRAPRRGVELRKRRKALLHDRRALRPAGVAGPAQSAGQDPSDQPGRDGADGQPVLRRYRAELRLGLGARVAQSVPRVLRRADGSVDHRRRGRQRRLDGHRGDQRRRPGRQLRLAQRRRVRAPRRARARSTRTPTTGATRP